MHYYDDAINRLKPFAEEHLDNEVANQHLGWSYIRAMDKSGKSRVEEGCAFYEKLASSHPDEKHAFLHQSLGTMYFERGAKFRDKSVAEWTLAAEQDPSYARPHVNLGWNHYDHKQYAEALTEFSKAFELGSNEFRTCMGAAATHYRLNHLDSAAYMYGRACELDPDDAEARWLLGSVREEQGAHLTGAGRATLFRRAVADYRLALQLAPHPTFASREKVEARIAALEEALAPPPPPTGGGSSGHPGGRPPRTGRPGHVPGTERPEPIIRPMMMAPPPEAGR
jgi:tetratricopeptide (TPR) repeat protein